MARGDPGVTAARYARRRGKRAVLGRQATAGRGSFGIFVAWVAYIWQPGLPAATARAFRPIYLLFLNKWYFDEIYDFLIVRPLMALGRGLWKKGDGAVIDGLGPDGLASTTRRLSIGASRLQTGYLYHYAFAMLIGVVVLVSWYLLFQIG